MQTLPPSMDHKWKKWLILYAKQPMQNHRGTNSQQLVLLTTRVSFLISLGRGVTNCNKLQRLKQQELPVDFTFQPKSGNAAFILSFSPVAETICETLSERCNRLSYQDHQRREYLHQKISVCHILPLC